MYVGMMSEVRRNDGVCCVILPHCLLHALAGAETFEMYCSTIMINPLLWGKCTTVIKNKSAKMAVKLVSHDENVFI